MARLRSIRGTVGATVTLTQKFYANGALFNPNSITSVTIYDAESGGNSVTTLTPTQQSTGVYVASWTIPAGTVPQIYYDEWIWTAVSSMDTRTQRHGFRVDGAVIPAGEMPGVNPVPLFVSSRELDFFTGINKELIQRIIGQKIVYYSVSEELTKTHSLYNEALRKTTLRPVEINALILFVDPQQTNTNFGIDTIYKIEVYFHKSELAERLIVPHEGDFVKFGAVFYEIEQLTEPQITFGQIDHKVMLKAVCRVSRQSQFDIAEGS